MRLGPGCQGRLRKIGRRSRAGVKDGIDRDGGPIAQEPVFLGVEEVQGVVDEFGWLRGRPTRALALDALFGLWSRVRFMRGVFAGGCPVGVIGLSKGGALG